MNGFETLTFAPFDRRLIAPQLMSGDEIAWLDDYHARVAELLMPLVAADTRTWLEAATKAFSGEVAPGSPQKTRQTKETGA
jgi:Xaa-Pro aminopeptidase